MSAALDDQHPRRDGITIPAIALWLVLSLLLHLALLLWNPPIRDRRDSVVEPQLTAYLRPAPQPEPPPPAQIEVPPEPPVTRPLERVPLRPLKRPAPPPVAKAPPPVIALPKPTAQEQPSVPAVPAVPPAPPVVKADPPPLAQTPQLTTPPPAETDLSAYIAARKRLRGEDVAPAETDKTARGPLNNAVLNQSPSPAFAAKKRQNGYGSFKIKRRGYDYAEFDFYGWNESFGRDWSQSVDVRKGNNSDIDIAVVRGIIEIIRRSENGDFTWYSYRLGRSLTLSARARDNGNLEDFIMKEFYDDLHRYR